MMIFKKIKQMWVGRILLLSGLLFCFGGDLGAQSTGFWKPGPEVPAELTEEQVYPAGRKFPIGGFSGDVDRDMEAGFTIVGPVYSGKEERLAEAIAYDQPIIYPIGLDMNFLKRNDMPAVQMTPEEIREAVMQQVKEVADHDHIVWWYLVPEEMRTWRAKEMEYLDTAAAAIREADPKKRPIWMYDPNHRGASSMARIFQVTDIVGKGAYTNYAGKQDERIWIKWGMEQQAEAIKQGKKPGISLLVPEMFRNAEDSDAIRGWVRHDVYLGLLEGAQGVMIFSFGRRANFSHFGTYFDAYAEVAKELTEGEKLGEVFLFGERRKEIETKVIKGPKKVEMLFEASKVTTPIKYSTLQSADIALGENRYLFLVNSSNEEMEVEVTGVPDNARWEILFAEGALTGETNKGKIIQLGPLEVAGYRFTPTP